MSEQVSQSERSLPRSERYLRHEQTLYAALRNGHAHNFEDVKLDAFNNAHSDSSAADGFKIRVKQTDLGMREISAEPNDPGVTVEVYDLNSPDGEPQWRSAGDYRDGRVSLASNDEQSLVGTTDDYMALQAKIEQGFETSMVGLLRVTSEHGVSHYVVGAHISGNPQEAIAQRSVVQTGPPGTF